MDYTHTVEIDIDFEHDNIDPDILLDYEGDKYSAAIAVDGRRVTVILNIGHDLDTAIHDARTWVEKRFGPCDIVSLTAMTNDEFDRRQALPSFPPIGGVSEIAEVLEVSRQRVAELRQRHDFPAPVATIKAGPIWRLGDLSRFADEWERKPGRPRKALEET